MIDTAHVRGVIKCANMQDVVDLVKVSNALASDSYQQTFDGIAAEELERLDLLVAQTQEQRIPVLRNGSNRYMEFASTPLSFDFRRFTAAGLTPDAFVVVPELTNLLGQYVTPRPPRSCLWELAASPLCPKWLTITDRRELGVNESVRAFDSHPSVLFYWRTVTDLVEKIGGTTEIDGIEVYFKPYKCDLASRFSDAAASSLFVHSRFFRGETGSDGKSGRVRSYRNPAAPNKCALTLIGDSHAFSGMAQLFAHYYEAVTFYWANRASGYGMCADAIARDHADHVIEESAERFLLSNFRVTSSASTRSG